MPLEKLASLLLERGKIRRRIEGNRRCGAEIIFEISVEDAA
jgi:hypothetical protein